MIRTMLTNMTDQGSKRRVVRDRLVQICNSTLHYMTAIGLFSKPSFFLEKYHNY